MKKFEFTAPEMIDGHWVDTRRTGTAEIVERGFQMQLGAEGYKLRVVESANYAPGTIITIFPWSLR